MLFIISLLLLIVVVFCDEECESGKQKQKLSFQVKGKEVSYKAEDKNGKCQLKLEAKFGCDGQCTAEGKIRDKQEASDLKAGIKYTIRAIQEVEASSNDDVWKVDKVVKDVKISDWKLDDLDCKCDDDAVEKGKSNEIGCEGAVVCKQSGEKDGATLTVQWTFVAEPAKVENEYELNPNSVKIDVTVENWTFEKNSNQFAIETALTTKAQLKDIDSDKNGKVHTKGVAVLDGGGIVWAEEYQTTKDGDMKAVYATPRSENGNDQKIVFVFEKVVGATSLLWDPEVMFASASNIAVSMLVVLSTLFVML